MTNTHTDVELHPEKKIIIMKQFHTNSVFIAHQIKPQQHTHTENVQYSWCVLALKDVNSHDTHFVNLKWSDDPLTCSESDVCDKNTNYKLLHIYIKKKKKKVMESLCQDLTRISAPFTASPLSFVNAVLTAECVWGYLVEDFLQARFVEQVQLLKLNLGVQKLLYPVQALRKIIFSFMQNTHTHKAN